MKQVLAKLPSKADGSGCSTYDGREIKDTEDLQSFQIFSPRDVPQPPQQINWLQRLSPFINREVLIIMMIPGP